MKFVLLNDVSRSVEERFPTMKVRMVTLMEEEMRHVDLFAIVHVNESDVSQVKHRYLITRLLSGHSGRIEEKNNNFRAEPIPAHHSTEKNKRQCYSSVSASKGCNC